MCSSVFRWGIGNERIDWIDIVDNSLGYNIVGSGSSIVIGGWSGAIGGRSPIFGYIIVSFEVIDNVGLILELVKYFLIDVPLESKGADFI